MFNIIKLRAENKRLKEELAQKDITIQYLNGCVNKANKRYIELKKQFGIFPNTLALLKSCENLDFSNPSEEADRQISIHDILEN